MINNNQIMIVGIFTLTDKWLLVRPLVILVSHSIWF